MAVINLSLEAMQAIAAFLAQQGHDSPVRIDLRSTGCCDPSLGLCLDQSQASDLIHEQDGLRFVISADLHQLIGDVTIDWVDEPNKKGYVLRSHKPVSEWDGFGVCDIRPARSLDGIY